MTTDGWTARDRAQIAEVFGLVGGELADHVWIEQADGHEWVAHFWYEGFPEYAESDFDNWHHFRTVVRDIMFGPPPERLGAWMKVATYMNSGETECPGRNEDGWGLPKGVHLVKSSDGINLVRADQCDGGDRCYYCDEKIGEEHGHIYIGDGWAEIVYQQDETEEGDDDE